MLNHDLGGTLEDYTNFAILFLLTRQSGGSQLSLAEGIEGKRVFDLTFLLSNRKFGMSFNIVCIEEVQHGHLSLVPGRLINCGFFNGIINHLNFGIIVQNDAALDDSPDIILENVSLDVEPFSGTSNKNLSNSHYTGS